MLVNLLLGLATFTAIYFFGDKMMLAFTKDPEVIRIGKEYLLIMGGFFIVHGGLNVFNGALRGSWRYPVPNGSKHHLSLADTHSPRLLV